MTEGFSLAVNPFCLNKRCRFEVKPKTFISSKPLDLLSNSFAVGQNKDYLLLSFPIGGNCGSCRPLLPDMGVLVGLVCTEPLRGCALHDKQWQTAGWDAGERWGEAGSGCTAWPCHTHICMRLKSDFYQNWWRGASLNCFYSQLLLLYKTSRRIDFVWQN